MSKFDVSEYLKQRPVIQLAPLVDIAFWALIFFMIIAVLNQMESEVNINVPKSAVTKSTEINSGKLVVNISKDGRFIVNQQEFNGAGLEDLLKKTARLFPNQQIIIRADELAYHKYVIQALDACMRSNIYDVSFATVREESP